MLTESVLYAAAGGVLGLFFAYAGVRAFDLATADGNRPYWLTFDLDYRVFGFVCVLVLVTGIVFGLAPAMHLVRGPVSDGLKEGGRAGNGRKSQRLAGAFVVAQLACTVVLLTAIGLLARSIVNVYRQASGFDPNPVLTMRLRLGGPAYADDAGLQRFHTRLFAAVRGVAGAESVSAASHLPLGGSALVPLEAEGHPLPPDGRAAPIAALTVSPEYLRTFGIPIAAGRDFLQTDGQPGQPNVLVNERFASKFWPASDPLGKRVRVDVRGRPQWLTVVGVAANVRQNQATARELAPVLFLPSRLAPPAEFWLAVRCSAPPATLARAIAREIQLIDPDIPVSSILTMPEVLRQARWPHRVFGSMFVIFGVIAAALAALIYSVVAYSVSLRTQEIGVRMALGATTAAVGWMIVRRGLRPSAIGVALGLAGALVVTRGLRALLIEVSSTDPLTFATVAALQIALALLASWIPATRAARVDPVKALRQT